MPTLGDIFQARFPFVEDVTQFKERPVFVWKVSADGKKVLASKITGTIRSSSWEVVLQPGQHSGLAKKCVVCVDETRYIQMDSLLYIRGSLNPFEVSVVKERYRSYLERYGK